MGMNRTLAITTIALIAVVMVVGTIIPAMAISVTGTILSINPSGKQGVIESTDADGSVTLYRFNIKDVIVVCLVDLAPDLIVFFNIENEHSRHATNLVVNCVSL